MSNESAPKGAHEIPAKASTASVPQRLAFDRLLAALDTRGYKVTGSDRQRKAQCPAHDDHNPSLSVTGIEGQALVYCHAGCDTADVMAALGMTTRDLFDDSRGVTYGYTDASGRPTRIVQRTPGKQFPQSGDKSRVQLYRLPAVVAAVAAGTTVYLVEGEKDVHALETLDAVATTSPMGARSFLKVDASPLEGAHVVVIPDRDEEGERYLRDALGVLQGFAASVKVARPKDGKDAADHVAAGHGLDDFQMEETPSRFDVEYLDRHQLDDLPTPAQLIDGVLTRHAYAMLTGRDSTYKSFVALDWSLCLATGRPWQNHDTERCRVLYIAGEGAYGLPRRVDAWEHDRGVTVEPGWFTVRRSAVNLYRPDNGALSELLARIESNQYGLVVIDTLRRASGGADGNGTDMGVVVDNIERIKRATGDGTALAVAHTDKGDNDARGYSGIEDDADIVWHAKVSDGHLTLKNTKQKDQAEHDEMLLCATPVRDSLVIEADRFSYDAPNTNSEAKILTALRGPFATEPATKTELMEVTELAKSTFYLARGRLLDSGQIEKVGSKYQIRESNGVQPADSAPDLGLSNESNGVQSKANSPVQSNNSLELDVGQTLDETLPEPTAEADALALLRQEFDAVEVTP